MVDDRRLTISSSARPHPDEIARRTFATSRRGFDTSEVRSYLELVGRELAEAQEREHALRESLADAERKAANPVLDEATLTSALGQETARVLLSAHEAASAVIARAESDASRTMAEAQEEAARVQARAEQSAADRASQSEALAAETRQRAQDEAAARVEAARVETETMLEQTRSECRSMLSEAQELRSRVLGDLTRRRRVLHTQIEQLRAGRERLAETIGAVRHTVDQVTDELFSAEDEAKMAAEAAGRHQTLQSSRGEELSEQILEAQASTSAALELVSPEGGSHSGQESPRVVGYGPRSGSSVAQSTPESLAESPTVDEGALSRGVDGEVDGVAGPEEGAATLTATPNSELGAEPNAAKEVTVDELFARLRSERETESSHEEDEGNTPSIAIDRSGESGDGDGDPLLTRRDEILEPIAATLARRLKRALTDDQNDILDRLRANKGKGAELLADEQAQRERYERASEDALCEAARAGASFAGGKSSDAPSVEDLVKELAAAIGLPLRRRLGSGEGGPLGQDDDVFVVEQIGAAFRDWKGARIERLAGDQAVAAFSRGELAVSRSQGSFRWVVDDDGVECPDCDDNALAGAVPRGESFPTGHAHPPAHAGCRCLLAPTDA